MRGAFLLALPVLLAALLSCSVDDSVYDASRCDGDDDCGSGLVCYRGFCIAGAGAACDDEGAVIDCYTGPEGTSGRGACRPGQRQCRQGELTACLGEVLPTMESTELAQLRVCNGIDDDCDGNIDEFEDTGCDTGAMGVCAIGTLSCEGASAICMPDSLPAPEECDGDDDDCDGTVDNEADRRCYPADTSGCVAGTDGTYDCTGLCATGVQNCTEGSLGSCSGATPPQAFDACTAPGDTAMDEDCDGNTDEDCDCSIGATQPCYGGAMGTEGTGTCTGGTQTCAEVTPGTNRWGSCAGEVVPAGEACENEGADDDCNGVDDDIAGRGDPCSAVAMGICQAGNVNCTDSALKCVAAEPLPETCNGLDDDCNGTVDDTFDLLTDPNNCGSCGNACALGQQCCAGACVNPQTNVSNCGSCGTACSGGEECCAGACSNTGSDSGNCGGCGMACGMDQTCCTGACVDTRSDEGSCGTCTTACAMGDQCCDSTCAVPTAPVCTGCPVDCSTMGETCCGGSCADTATDPSHCGACDNSCGMGELCCGGACVPNDPTNCGACGSSCGMGQLCCGSSCINVDAANCGSCGNACGGGETCCGAFCANLLDDPTSCGTCGTVCAAGESCQDGACCAPPLTGCGGACVDLDTDRANCGRCGRSCGSSRRCDMGCCCGRFGCSC